jgi:GT2 family glycosyltransferase
MNLLIVIVNYRTPELTIDCLRSLEPEVEGLPGTSVVVTDNASGDDSLLRLEAAARANGWERWVKILPLEYNGGFAFGNNGAIGPALASAEPPRYVMLLNSDTLVRSGALKTLVGFLDERPDVGLAGARMEDPDGTPQASAFRFHSVLGELEDGFRFGPVSKLLARYRTWLPPTESACQVDWVTGACLVVRREVFEAVGLLDDRFFMYYEEVDFCLRARRAGWLCWHVPQARVVHLLSGSSGGVNATSARKRKPDYYFESRRRYFLAHHGAVGTALADIAWATGYALYDLRRVLFRKPDVTPRLLLWDFVRHSVKPLRDKLKPGAPADEGRVREEVRNGR